MQYAAPPEGQLQSLLLGQGQQPGTAGAGPGQLRLGSGKGSSLSQRVLGTAQAPQGMGTAPRLPELQELPGMDRLGLLGGLSWIYDP